MEDVISAVSKYNTLLVQMKIKHGSHLFMNFSTNTILNSIKHQIRKQTRLPRKREGQRIKETNRQGS